MKVALGRQTWGPGVTGNVYDAVTQLRAKVEDTTDAAVTEGQKDVQAAVNTGANYLEQVKSLASSAISTAAVCLSILPVVSAWACAYFRMQSYLPTSLTGRTAGSAGEAVQGALGNDMPPGGFPATSTELESGPHTVSSPYPASDVQARQIAVNESK